MPELMRFRVARAPQRSVPDAASIVRPLPASAPGNQVIAPSSPMKSAADLDQQLRDLPHASLKSAADCDRVLRQIVVNCDNRDVAFLLDIDEQLAANGNMMEPKAIKDKMAQAKATTDSSAWAQIRATKCTLLENTLLQDLNTGSTVPQTGLLVRVLRLILVAHLIELLTQPQVVVKSKEDVYSALRWCTVVLSDPTVEKLRNATQRKRLGPVTDPNVNVTDVFARRPGFADLYITTEDWFRYELGEIANIANILPGESFGRSHREVDETVTSVTTDKTTSTYQETSSQTTDRTSLQVASSNDTKLALHADGKVDVSATYGVAHIDTHVGGSLDYSQDQASSRAVTQSKETVDRAVRSVTETVREIRSTQTKVRVTDDQHHNIDNSGKTGRIDGVYHWVSRVASS